jgi:hypothetical protein
VYVFSTSVIKSVTIIGVLNVDNSGGGADASVISILQSEYQIFVNALMQYEVSVPVPVLRKTIMRVIDSSRIKKA